MAPRGTGDTTVRIERHPFDYDLAQRFPDRQPIGKGFTGAAYVAEQAGKFYLLLDESIMLDRVIPETEPIIDSLIGVYEFDDPGERDAFATSKGWLPEGA